MRSGSVKRQIKARQEWPAPVSRTDLTPQIRLSEYSGLAGAGSQTYSAFLSWTVNRKRLFSSGFRQPGYSATGSGTGSSQKSGESEVGAAIEFESPSVNRGFLYGRSFIDENCLVQTCLIILGSCSEFFNHSGIDPISFAIVADKENVFTVR